MIFQLRAGFALEPANGGNGEPYQHMKLYSNQVGNDIEFP
jgi:hypothetical protein